MSDPPSVSDSSTACDTIVASTSSATRVELIASPTSASASSCSTLRPSSAERFSSARDELDVPQGERRLLGEGREQLPRAVVEGLDLVAPHRQDADDLVADEHRRAHHRAVAADLLEGELRVVGVGEDVLDLLGGAVHADASDEGRRGRARTG